MIEASTKATVPARYRARLVKRDRLSASVEAYRFRVESSAGFRWLSGQHVELFSSTPSSFPLLYSIASAPDPARPGEFELAVGEGSGSELMNALEAGAEMFVSEARGEFVWPARPGPALLVGAGTGVAPLRALLQTALASGNAAPLVLLTGYRGEADILWRDEFESAARGSPDFGFQVTLTQPGEKWNGRRGRVQEHVLELAQTLVAPSIYLCGSLAMIAAAREVLEKGADVPRERILAEGY